jgi:hypothetical protein
VRDDEIIVRNWFQHRKEGSVLLKIIVENKTTESHKVRVRISHDPTSEEACNVKLPQGDINDGFLFSKEKKCIIHLEKINCQKPFSKIKVEVITKPKKVKPVGGNMIMSSGGNRKYFHSHNPL